VLLTCPHWPIEGFHASVPRTPHGLRVRQTAAYRRKRSAEVA
jgi:hypothetical protein